MTCTIYILAPAAYKGSCGTGVNWTLNTETGVLNISGSGAMNDYDINSASLPWGNYKTNIKYVVIEVGVTSIGNAAFRFCNNLISVDIADTVTTIGKEAFYSCERLVSVDMSDGVVSIGESAFSRCTALSDIELSSKLTTIGNSAFYCCTKMTDIVIPNKVISIGDRAFSECKLLANVKMSDTVQSIKAFAFYNCTSLKSIVIPSSVTSISESTFRGCTSLTSVQLSPGLIEIQLCAFDGCSNLVSINLPDTLKTIGNSSFRNCTKLQSIALPDGLMTIGECAFQNTAIERIKIPKTVTHIGDGAFTKCNSLEKIALLNSNTEIKSDAHKNTLGAVGVTTVYGYSNSTAYDYAMGNGYAFECITSSNLWEDTQAYVNPFADIKESDYFYEPVCWAVREQITAGTTDMTFSPNASCTRGQVVTFLWRAMGEPSVSNGRTFFNDVKSGDYYYKAVLWAAGNGITDGTSDTTFSPDIPCTRGQVVTFLWRTAGKSSVSSGGFSFSDVKSEEYYYTAVQWAVKNGITDGTSSRTSSPDALCTRAQVVTFLNRYYN